MKHLRTMTTPKPAIHLNAIKGNIICNTFPGKDKCDDDPFDDIF